MGKAKVLIKEVKKYKRLNKEKAHKIRNLEQQVMMLKNEADPEVRMKIEYLFANKQNEAKVRPSSSHP